MSQSSQPQQTQLTPISNTFINHLLTAFIGADIPLYKLRHPKMETLFKHMGFCIPSDSTVRTRIGSQYDSEIERLRNYIKDKKMFFIVDESDISGKKFVNVLVGEPTVSFACLCVPLLFSPNADTIYQILFKAILLLRIESENICLLLSDAASYMLRCGILLKSLAPNMFHVTCLAHLLHNCAMRVRNYYKKVDLFIATIKMATVKNQQRRRDFDGIGLPPAPVVTRWASWIRAAEFYVDNFVAVRQIVQSWTDAGQLCMAAKEAVAQDGIVSDLAAIKRCYASLAKKVIEIEGKKCTILKGCEIVRSLQFDDDPVSIKEYMQKRLEKNDISAIENCSKPLVDPSTYALLHSAQCTSADVERSFSMLGKMLDKRRQFNDENIEKYFILYLGGFPSNKKLAFK
jgi:hypothetical protein